MEPAAARLVVGLGNPGEKYAGTRHNAGFLALDAFVEKFGGEWREFSRGDGLEAKMRLGSGVEVRAAKPLTYMNASGRMAVAMARFYKIAPGSVLIVADDFSLPLGRIRVRKKGSAGGQNGLESILQGFGTLEIPRVRLGIGPVPPGKDPASFVLGRFSVAQRDALENMLGRAREAIEVCCEEGIDAAMNAFNGTEA